MGLVGKVGFGMSVCVGVDVSGCGKEGSGSAGEKEKLY